MVAALREVFEKIQLVWTAVFARQERGWLQTTEDWKRKARDTMAAISRCNDREGVSSLTRILEPQTDGSARSRSAAMSQAVKKH